MTPAKREEIIEIQLGNLIACGSRMDRAALTNEIRYLVRDQSAALDVAEKRITDLEQILRSAIQSTDGDFAYASLIQQRDAAREEVKRLNGELERYEKKVAEQERITIELGTELAALKKPDADVEKLLQNLIRTCQHHDRPLGIPLDELIKADADALRALYNSLKAEQEHAVEAEQGRWQEAIYNIVSEVDSEIDGGGCDSGDPLDVSLTEIGMAFNEYRDQIDSLKAERDRLDLQESHILDFVPIEFVGDDRPLSEDVRELSKAYEALKADVKDQTDIAASAILKYAKLQENASESIRLANSERDAAREELAFTKNNLENSRLNYTKASEALHTAEAELATLKAATDAAVARAEQ